MAKDLRTFIADCERQLPGEVIHITKEVNPANYDVTAIIKHLGAQKKFPIIIFDNPLNLNGKVGPIKLTMNCEISQGKTQIALGMPRDATRPQMAEKCLEMEEHRVPPSIISRKDAPIKQNTMVGDKVDLYQIPIMRHHEMDGGPYIVLSTITKDRKVGDLQLSYHRMEVKSKNYHGALRFAAPSVEDLQRLRGKQHGDAGGDRVGPSSGIPHGRLLQRPV